LLDSPRLVPAADRPEDAPIDLNAAVAPVLGAAVIGLSAAVLVLLLLLLFLARQVGRLRRRLDSVTRGVDGASLHGVLDAHLDRVTAVAAEVDNLSARSAVLEAVGRRAVQRIGLVRFNPFEDTGGNQSFALALTDARGTGFILSSLHSRTGTRVYAKGVTDGMPDGALSDEERQALGLALTSAAPSSVARRPGDPSAAGSGSGAG
jgi:hypothetical protein